MLIYNAFPLTVRKEVLNVHSFAIHVSSFSQAGLLHVGLAQIRINVLSSVQRIIPHKIS